MLKKLTTDNFSNEVLNNSGVVLVDFYADWCGPCKMLSPIIERIASENTAFSVGKINVDENNSLAADYHVISIPTLIIFKGGKEQTRLTGYHSKEAILKELLPLL